MGKLEGLLGRRVDLPVQNFDCPYIIYGQVGKSRKPALQQKFTTCPILRVSHLNPYVGYNPTPSL